MSHATQSQANITTGLGILERVMSSTVTIIPCCVFLLINGTMLFTLRSKPVFRETSRYILLYNLLFADTTQLVQGQLLYLLASSRIRLTYPLCGVLVVLTKLTTDISPLTLLVMSLERYVAVCYPLRHATIITIRNTGLAIVVVWAFCSLNALTQIFLTVHFPFTDLESLEMKDFCGTHVMFVGSLSDNYDKVYINLVFISVTVTIVSSYIGVMVAARSASTDKASARKARNTLLLHLVQLGLSLLSTMYNSLLVAVSKIVTRTELVRILNVFYVFIIMLPRCLSSLIYGLRDQTIRPVLLYYLCCHLNLSVFSAKADLSP